MKAIIPMERRSDSLRISEIKPHGKSRRAAAFVAAAKQSRLRKMYLRAAQRNPSLVGLARSALRFARGEVNFKQLVFPGSSSPRKWRDVSTLQDFVRLFGLTPVVLAPAEGASYPTSSAAPIFGSIPTPAMETDPIFPQVYTVRLSDMMVFPATNFFISEEKVIIHDLLDLKAQKPPEELTDYFQFNPARSKARVKLSYHFHDDLDEAAHFLDAAAQNYAHWLTEILPRIALFCSRPEFAHVPLLIDDNLPQSMLQSLHLIAGEHRRIFTLGRGIAVKVKKLHVVSVTGYVPFGFRSPSDTKDRHGQFSPFALNCLRQMILESTTTEKPASEAPKKIFIQRNSTHRSLVNQPRVMEFCVQHSFECVSPETLSFTDQVRLFSNAEAVIGATGSAFANIIFCSPSCKITILIGDHPETPYGYWVNIAAAVGARVRYVLGQSDAPISGGIHRDFSISEQKIVSLIEHG
jgi:capsular polysaccharide biosynthesis protein